MSYTTSRTMENDTHAMPQSGDYVEITIAPPDCEEKMHIFNPEKREKKFLEDYVELIKEIMNYEHFKEYLITYEVSLNGRLHWHGIVQLGEVPRYALMRLQSFEVAEIRNGKLKAMDYKRRYHIYRFNDKEHFEKRKKYINKDVKQNKIYVKSSFTSLLLDS